MDQINVDYTNPFLYISIFSAISAGVNLYCCFCTNKYHKNESEIQLTSVVTDASNFNRTNEVIDESCESTETRVETRNVQTTSITTNDADTQTDDSVFYDLMGKRWNEELEFYRHNNMKRKV